MCEIRMWGMNRKNLKCGDEGNDIVLAVGVVRSRVVSEQCYGRPEKTAKKPKYLVWPMPMKTAANAPAFNQSRSAA